MSADAKGVIPGRRYGRWAVVTGASEGIGRAFADALAAAGFNLILAARRGEVLSALAHALEARGGIEVRTIAGDLASDSGIAALERATTDLDVGLLVAAAGYGTSGAFVDATLADELGMIDLNCRSVVSLTHTFARRFVGRGAGGLVLLSSLVAFQGVPRAANYAATKAFIQTFAEGLRVELKPCGVEVLAVAPGPVQSGFAARANMQMGLAQTPEAVARGALRALGSRGTVRPGFLARFLELSLKPLPRWGRTRAMGLVMAGMTRHQTTRSGDRARKAS